eukprot:snap_masked-scaffold_1-processed-gene-19.32-mRNA-1 protein AED:1.00 eAED:1.00 QI:0/0/0/0/1/1/3/0/92
MDTTERQININPENTWASFGIFPKRFTSFLTPSITHLTRTYLSKKNSKLFKILSQLRNLKFGNREVFPIYKANMRYSFCLIGNMFTLRSVNN